MAIANHPTHPEVDLLDGRWYANEPHETWTWMRHNAPVYLRREVRHLGDHALQGCARH